MIELRSVDYENSYKLDLLGIIEIDWNYINNDIK